jgi:hypothetical protein
MLTFARVSTAATVGTVLAVAVAGAAFATGGTVGVNCSDGNRPGCSVSAGTPGSTGTASGVTPQSSGAAGACYDPSGVVIACERDGAWAGSDGCYYAPTSPSSSTVAAMGGQPSGSGGWYQRTCYGPAANGAQSFGGPVWLAGAPPAAVSPEVVAQQAVSRLALPAATIRLSPSGEQLTGLPVWMWLDSASWGSRAATASVPGLSVTATATPVAAVWRMGDGNQVVCRGPGTPWRAGMDPAAASPTCGYRYRRSSAGQPGGSYAVTVSVGWQVSWSGGGRTGKVPNLGTAGAVRVQVAEAQALITR